MEILETLAWVIFGFFVLLFILPIIRVIRKIMNFCKNTREEYDLETKTEQENTKEARIMFQNESGIEESESQSNPPKDMKTAWADINQETEMATMSTSPKETRENGITRRQKEMEMNGYGPDLNT